MTSLTWGTAFHQGVQKDFTRAGTVTCRLNVPFTWKDVAHAGSVWGRGLRSAGGGRSDAHGGWQAVLLLGSLWHADVGRDAVALAG